MSLTYRPRHQDLIFISTILPYDDKPTRQEWPPLSAVTEERMAIRTVVNVLEYLHQGGQYPFASSAERHRFMQSVMPPGQTP